MTEADELREHAERCRRLAKTATDRNVARVLIGMAEEYLARAERLERRASAPKTPTASPEQQPVQQQQQTQPKKEEKE